MNITEITKTDLSTAPRGLLESACAHHMDLSARVPALTGEISALKKEIDTLTYTLGQERTKRICKSIEELGEASLPIDSRFIAMKMVYLAELADDDPSKKIKNLKIAIAEMRAQEKHNLDMERLRKQSITGTSDSEEAPDEMDESELTPMEDDE